MLVLAAGRTVAGHRKSRRLAEQHQVPPSGLLHVLALRQWLTLLVGITVVSIGTGAVTGVRVLASDDAGPVTPTLSAAPILAAPPPSEAESPEESLEPTESVEPVETSDPADETTDPTESVSATPAPGSTKYLDSEDALSGYFDAKAVTFSAARYPRGIMFYCESATSSALQWNVAGTTRFQATAGIDDNTPNAYGKIVEFLFYDQDGRKLVAKPIEVSVGHPKKVALDLTGVVSLRMTCAARDGKTNEQRNTYVAFGDPIVVNQ